VFVLVAEKETAEK